MTSVRFPVRSVVSDPQRSVIGGVGESLPALPSLSVSIDPASVAESAGSTTGTVTRPADQTTGILTVNLSSSDTSEATVPATVDIPNGQQSADFTITILNENLADGDQVATISASATDYNGGSANVTVTDVGVSSGSLSTWATGWFNPYDTGTVSGVTPILSVSDSGSQGGSWAPGAGQSGPDLVTENGATFMRRPAADNLTLDWSNVPSPATVDLFAVIRGSGAVQRRLLSTGSNDFVMRFIDGAAGFPSDNAFTPAPVHYVDDVEVTTRNAAHDAAMDGSWHRVRVANLITSPMSGNPVRLMSESEDAVFDIATLAFVESSTASANLSDINTELDAIIADLNS